MNSLPKDYKVCDISTIVPKGDGRPSPGLLAVADCRCVVSTDSSLCVDTGEPPQLLGSGSDFFLNPT